MKDRIFPVSENDKEHDFSIVSLKKVTQYYDDQSLDLKWQPKINFCLKIINEEMDEIAQDKNTYIKTGKNLNKVQTAIIKNSPKTAVRSVGDGELVEFNVVIGEKGNEASNVSGPEGIPVKGSPHAGKNISKITINNSANCNLSYIS